MAKKKPATEPVEKVLTPPQQQEYLRCMYDIPYFAEKYCKVWNKGTAEFVPFVLFPHQLKTIDAYERFDNNLILKYRQGGITTTTCLFIAHLLTFTKDVKVAVVANTLTLAQENIFAGIVDIIANLPEWLRMEPTGKDSQKKKIYENGATLMALAAGKDGTRGFSPDLIFIDEAAYLQYGDAFMTATMGALSAGGKIILNSTPHGQDPVYYAKYNGSIRGENDFNIVEIFWYEDPRFIYNQYTKELELSWVKKEGDVEHVVKTADRAVYRELMKQGYEPTSPWFEKQCAKYDYDPKRIAQELKGSFIGSGGNLIADEYIIDMENTTVRAPDTTNSKEDGKFWFWGSIKPEARYLLFADVSKGTSEDYSSIEIFEVHNDGVMEQVAELQCKYPPEVLAQRINKYGRMYNMAYVVIDVTGGIGVVTMDNLLRENYPLDKIHHSEIRAKPVRDRLAKHMNEKQLVPGFAIGGNRELILEELERRVRHGEIIVRSKRLIEEFRGFVFINGRYDHGPSNHDDLLMATAMGLYAFKYSFGTMQGPSFEQVLMQAECWTIVSQDSIREEWMEENHVKVGRKYEADPFRDEDFSRDGMILPFY